ncbi:MAG: OmpA family protein [Bacteroidales bacterium]
MIKKLFLLVFIIKLVPYVSGQEYEVLTKENSDCTGAILIQDSVFGPTTPPPGPGHTIEITGDADNPLTFEREHHTTWYQLVAPADGLMEFTIIPLAKEDDYDFLLYRKSQQDICKAIKNGQLQPIRSNISRNNPAINSITGIRETANDKYVPQGPGADFSKAVEVSAKDTFLLVVDNVYPNGKGHRLNIRFQREQEEQKEIRKEHEKDTNHFQLILSIKDSENKKTTNADIVITSPQEKEPVVAVKDISQLIKALKAGQKYEVEISKDHYFSELRHLQAVSKDSILRLEIELTRIEKGNTLELKNLYFHSSSASFKRESYKTLRHLLSIMQEHPGLKIAIRGHVNQPYQWDDRTPDDFLMRLSQRRAEAVKRYLVRRGISNDRMITEGLSNREMIYPYADTEEEMEANRRVEILVLDIETDSP